MNNKMYFLLTLIIMSILSTVSACSTEHALNIGSIDQHTTVPCSDSGDKDLDGVPDAVDSSVDDSGLEDPYGLGQNDPATGAGDGLPDCE